MSFMKRTAAFMSAGIFFCAIFTAAALVGGPTRPGPAMAETRANDTATCMACHDQHPVNDILNSPHAQLSDPRTPFAQGGCQSCHGDASEHLRNVKTHPPVDFSATSSTPVKVRNNVCLACHEKEMATHWHGSQHEIAEVSCTSCHQVHEARQRVSDPKQQAQVCLTCHQLTRAELRRFSHHPVLEGQMTCSSCHAPHGSFGDAMLAKSTVNETCYACHAEKRGPFLWEHAPVSENCSLCHSPHGANQEALLTVRGPLMCQQCHSADFHPGTLYSGSGVQPLGADRHVVAQNCLNCHPRVHGSNHPAGIRFTR